MADETLADYMPTEGWLGAWCKEMSDVIAAPQEFILAAGLGALSATIGKQLWFGLGKRKWYPHLWIMLLAPAGIRKSIAVNQTSKAVRFARGKDAFLPNRWSPESFWDGLEQSTDGYWNVGEISGFLGSSRKDYMSGARSELCDVWDSQSFIRRTRTKTNDIDDPAPTAMATGRIDDFMNAAGLSDFRSGFFSRWLIVTTKVTGQEFYRGMLESDQMDDNATDARFDDLYRLGIELRNTKPRKISFTHDAMVLWEDYDRRWTFEEHVDELSGFARRRGIQAAKLAILHTIGTTFNPHVTVDPNSVAWGLAVSEACFEQVRAMQMDEIGMSAKAQERDRIWKKVRDLGAKSPHGVVRERDLYTRIRFDFDDPGRRDKQITIWEQSGLIERGWLKPPAGRSARVFRIINGSKPPENWFDKNPDPSAENPQTKRRQCADMSAHSDENERGE
jgi:hypothetical protein